MPSQVAFTTCGDCGSTLLICSRPGCGKSFPRRVHEDETSWGSRRYCSTECAAAARQVVRFADRVLAEKPCARHGCDQFAKQRQNESPASFEDRKYCGHECACKARRTSSEEELAIRRKRKLERKLVAAAADRQMHPNTSEYTRKPVYQPAPPQEIPAAPVEPPRPAWRPGLWRELDEARSS